MYSTRDQALDFYVGKLGFELNTDADLGSMRWLPVNFPGQPEHQLLLEKPGPPAHDEATAEQRQRRSLRHVLIHIVVLPRPKGGSDLPWAART